VPVVVEETFDFFFTRGRVFKLRAGYQLLWPEFSWISSVSADTSGILFYKSDKRFFPLLF